MVDVGWASLRRSLPAWPRIARAAPAHPEARRAALLSYAACGLALFFLAILAARIVGETGNSNSYALLAEALLAGRLDVSGCFDTDCAVLGDRTYIVFPPGPVVIALPFVALFGVSFSGFIALTAAITGLAMAAWWQVLRILQVPQRSAFWLLIGIAFASPLYYVTMRGDGIWFFAHAVAFCCVTIAIREAVRGGSLWLAGAFLGMAFLSRQLTILLSPFVFALTLRRDEPLVAFRIDYMARGVRFAVPVAAAIAVYLAYNYARFGDPLETGYVHYIQNHLGERTVLDHRVERIGLFSPDYFLFNVLYLLFQGPHMTFVGPERVVLGGFDRFGTSLLAASPFVLFAFFAPLRRTVLIGGLTILAMVAPMLFYHSNGFTQYNVQRYVLDWLPVLAYVLALSVTPALRPAFALVVTYALLINAAVMLLVAATV